ncbi:MAG: DNA adenine methylase [Armatimonadetes bacterium]|nr:DNA adenine methylase [Armatimonadota bacterium]
MLNSPFKWVGGKSRLRKYIIGLLPDHTCYLEIFSGAAWVLFGKPPSDVEIINDIDQNLVTFFRVVKEKPEELIASFEWDLVSRAEFERLAELDPSTLTDVERAHRFYYLIMAGWGGELNYPRFQTSITDGGHGNRLIGALKTLRERLQPVHDRLRTVIVENLDWRECLDRYDRVGVVMYVDPPYPGNKCNYAHNMRNWEQHHALAERLRQTKCRWILSSYDIPEMHNLFSGHYIMAVQSASGMNVEKNGGARVMNREVLITNFAPPKSLVASQAPVPPQQTLLELEAAAEYKVNKQSGLVLLHSPYDESLSAHTLLK